MEEEIKDLQDKAINTSTEVEDLLKYGSGSPEPHQHVGRGAGGKNNELPSKELLRLENNGEDESELPGWDD